MTMAGVAAAFGIGSLIAAGGAIAGGAAAWSAANEAEEAQRVAAAKGLGAVQKGTEQARADLGPYAQAGMGGVGGLRGYQQAGTDALAMQRALAGLDGPEAQRQAIAMLESSPQFQALTQQSEEAILANASATGGLRGGNIQGALAQNRQNILAGLIDQQMGRLGGIAGAGLGAAGSIAGLGQSSASGQASAGIQGAGAIADLYGNIGAAKAAGALGRGAAIQGMFQGVGQAGQSLTGGLAGLNSTGGL